jgi:chorismate mutase
VAVEDVTEGRGLIDQIDREIQELVRRRGEVSREIQALRVAKGEPRVSHQRENQIIAGYREALGRPGIAIALATLAYCRGEDA